MPGLLAGAGHCPFPTVGSKKNGSSIGYKSGRIITMSSMNITLPEPLKEFIEELVAKGTFKDPSDYLQTLVDRDRQERERIEALLIEGLDSGPSTPMTAEDWQEIRR